MTSFPVVDVDCLVTWHRRDVRQVISEAYDNSTRTTCDISTKTTYEPAIAWHYLSAIEKCRIPVAKVYRDIVFFLPLFSIIVLFTCCATSYGKNTGVHYHVYGTMHDGPIKTGFPGRHHLISDIAPMVRNGMPGRWPFRSFSVIRRYRRPR